MTLIARAEVRPGEATALARLTPADAEAADPKVLEALRREAQAARDRDICEIARLLEDTVRVLEERTEPRSV